MRSQVEINVFGPMTVTRSAEPAEPLRWAASEDVVEGVEDKARLLLAQADAHRQLSTSLAHADAKAAA